MGNEQDFAKALLEALQQTQQNKGGIIIFNWNSPITINTAPRDQSSRGNWLGPVLHKLESSSLRVALFLISIVTLCGFVAHEVGWPGRGVFAQPVPAVTAQIFK